MFKVYHVSYDLKYASYDDYKRVWDRFDKLKNMPILKSTYLVATNKSAEELYEFFKPVINGTIFISEINENCQGFMAKRAWEWIKKMQPVSLFDLE